MHKLSNEIILKSGRTNVDSMKMSPRLILAEIEKKKRYCWWKLRRKMFRFGPAGIKRWSWAAEQHLPVISAVKYCPRNGRFGKWTAGVWKTSPVCVPGTAWSTNDQVTTNGGNVHFNQICGSTTGSAEEAWVCPPHPKGTFTDNEGRNAGRAGTQGGFN